MLDTNIVSNALRYPFGNAAAQMTVPGQAPVCVSAIVAAEMRFGARRVQSERLTAQVEGILQTMDVLPIDDAVSRHYADIRTNLEQRGAVIGPYDLLIAAHALSLDLTLVTDNIREFSRVHNLRVENWLD